MQLEMEKLKNQINKSTGASSGDTFSPNASTETTVRKTAAKSQPKPKESSPEVCGEGLPPPESEAAKMARLRRICERKPSGKIRCDQELHDKWKNGSKEDREGLLELLESCNWDKACDLGNLNWSSFWERVQNHMKAGPFMYFLVSIPL